MHKLFLEGDISVNCYIVDYNNKCFIIDPGYQKQQIVDFIKSNNLTVEGILLTHGHLDHIGAIDCFDVPVYVYEQEYDLLVNDSLNGFKTLGVNNPIDINKINFQKFDLEHIFMLDDKQVSFIHTPGHTAGGVCYIFDDMIFTGDTLFKNSVGRWDFPTGDIEKLQTSVVNLIDAFPDEYKVYPGHNSSSTIGDEKKYNQFYKDWKN